MRPFISFSHLTAGFVAVLVGFTSSAVLVFQAAAAAGATPAEISSWLFALGVGISISCVSLSLYYRMPILIGWSTPGAALLVTSLSGVSMSEAIGAFIFSAGLTWFTGITGIFERVMAHIPRTLASAMLAGILIHFGLNVFSAMEHQFMMVSVMLLIYLIGKRTFPRYVILLVLVVGVALAKMKGLFHIEDVHLTLTSPIFTTPVFTLSTLMSVGVPLFIVNMTSQNIPGITVLNNAGFRPPISPLISWTGFTNMLLAPLGCYGITLAAITGAICCSKEADENAFSRYKSTLFAGLCWFIIGIFGSTIVAVFFAFPNELILTVAGLALFTTIGNSLKAALHDDIHREPALITILLSASGITLFGMGAAFWGLIGGIVASFILNWRKPDEAAIKVSLS